MTGWTLKTDHRRNGLAHLPVVLPLGIVTAVVLLYEAMLLRSPVAEPATPLGVMRGIAEVVSYDLQGSMISWLLGAMLTSVLPLFVLGHLMASRLPTGATGSMVGRRTVLVGISHHLLPLLVIGAMTLGVRADIDPAISAVIWLITAGAALTSALGTRRQGQPKGLMHELARIGIAFCGLLIAAAAAGLILASLERTALPIDVAQFLAGAAGEASWPLVLLTLIASICGSMLMPPFAAYLILTTLISPALRTVGVADITIHLLPLFGCLIGGAMRLILEGRFAGGQQEPAATVSS